MELLDRYELILSQALDELGPLDLPDDQQEAFQTQALLAPDLGDILYRLSIEHGIEFTPFRETVISLISDHKPAMAANGSGKERSEPFAADLEEAHPLIILALEMMPPDCPY